ncbi:hypothetical protein HME9302_01073 [Alteripontixanthobacter maritimus]|uniref:DUF883 domain-containing protein n=1 Tax=Alteripontixanthobacter maritimus TaxID=2161824 RepID=A0A369Q9E3_9SPHN|nr:hypothetical protein [Alteripontixanthobacter maritimus]RDC59877.1 hypothetical protein HME9302_01073 [Alteripontixanthobacter maritimus]
MSDQETIDHVDDATAQTPEEVKREKREVLRNKIESGERRNEERTFADRAREAGDTATEFVKAYPIATIAGVAVLGLAIGAMTRPGRRVGAQAGRKASAFATYATEMGLAYAGGLFDSAGDVARAGGVKVENLGDTVAHSARKAKRTISTGAAQRNDDAKFVSRKAARRASRAYRDLRARLPG